MPLETWSAALVIVILGGLAALAIWKRAAIDLHFGTKGFDLKTTPGGGDDSKHTAQTAAGVVDKVAEGARIAGEVGTIAGEERAAGEAAGGHALEIAKQMTVERGGKVDKIVGHAIVRRDE